MTNPDHVRNALRCLLCGAAPLFTGLLCASFIFSHLPIGPSLALTLALGAPLAWAHWRWCPGQSWQRPERLIRLEDGKLIVGQPADGNRLSDWLCGDAWLNWRAMPFEAIHSLRLTPGYLAIYLKPSLAAVDVMFQAQATEDVRRILAPLSHLFVEEMPR